MFKLHLGLTGKMVKSPPNLLNWQVVHERMPWNIILLLGGGFALAAGSEVRLLTNQSVKARLCVAALLCFISLVFGALDIGSFEQIII